LKFIFGWRACCASAALALLCAPGAASEAEAVIVKEAWVRATAPGQKAAAAYMELTSVRAAALVAAESPAAGRAELHSMSLAGGVMKMRPVQSIELPAGKTVGLAPGGLHVMLFDVKRPLKAGDRVPIVLAILQADGTRAAIRVEADVRAIGERKAGHRH
jgi:periplasmic copper chaperone A